MRGLVVGDNLRAATAIGQALGADGFNTTLHRPVHPHDTLEHLRHGDCDAVVFDCPRASCHGDCLPRQLRAQGNPLPVLVIAPRGPDWIGCLNTGADNYIAAPYETAVLLARLRALVRRCRCSRASPPVQRGLAQRADVKLDSLLQIGDLRLDLITRTAQRGGKMIELTPRETRLLELLMRHAGEPCSRKLIREHAWGYRCDPGTKVLEVNINRLRAKIDTGFETRMIEMIHGVGYRLSALS